MEKSRKSPAPLLRGAAAPYFFETSIDLGERSVPLVARVNRKARRLIVKVDEIGGRVLVTAPSKRAIPEAIKFAQARAAWILERFEAGLRPTPFVAGGVCPYRGAPHVIANAGGPRAPVRVQGPPPQIIVGGAPEHLNRRLVDWLKREARKALEERTLHHAQRLGRKPSRLSIRDGRSRWGSCTKDGAISYSWRLILAPPQILDYVAAHECAHLVHLDHSRAYWKTVASLDVDATEARRWFDRHGAALHAFGVAGVSQQA